MKFFKRRVNKDDIFYRAFTKSHTKFLNLKPVFCGLTVKEIWLFFDKKRRNNEKLREPNITKALYNAINKIGKGTFKSDKLLVFRKILENSEQHLGNQLFYENSVFLLNKIGKLFDDVYVRKIAPLILHHIKENDASFIIDKSKIINLLDFLLFAKERVKEIYVKKEDRVRAFNNFLKNIIPKLKDIDFSNNDFEDLRYKINVLCK